MRYPDDALRRIAAAVGLPANADPAAIAAEVERLRSERDEARATERRAVVAWLRDAPGRRMWRQDPMDAAADAIERGEHLPDPEAP